MKNKAAKQKSKRKGSDNAFGCDLNEHLQNSGHEVPQVLKTCAEFIEKHGIVDGIYRLSGITSNIQRLRQEFNSEQSPDLTKEVYLQDIHCVGSLCKLYFRELPNPLLTYELYQRFTDTVCVKEEHEQLTNVRQVIEELPIAHFRTLEYLAKHLAHLATLSHQTNMHTRNLALVWAPNLLRSKEIEVSACNGDEAFLEVRVQQSVVEFILNHTEQIFNHAADPPRPKEGSVTGASVMCVEKYATLPAVGQCPPMKLMSLEEAQARSLGPNHPARIERQRENSLPDTSTAAMYHTVIELSENKRKFSGKSKKWKSIFSLGRSVTDAKGKLSRNGSVFMRAQNVSEKTVIRPSKSMDSLCSLPTDDDKAAAAGAANGFFSHVAKSRTLGSDINYDPNEQDSMWEFDLRKASGVTAHGPSAQNPEFSHASSSTSPSPASPASASSPLQRALPEQLKVYKGDESATCRPTSPKNRRTLYSGSHNGSSRPSFPGSLFPLESSPRHQRKALNISEPFAVSVPLRVSAVISSNSTPCRVAGKGGTMKPGESAGFREPLHSSGGSSDLRDRERLLGGRDNPPGNSGGHGIYSNSNSAVPTEESQAVERGTGVVPSDTAAQSSDAELKEPRGSVRASDDRMPTQPKTTGTAEHIPRSPGKKLDATLMQPNEPKKLEQLDVKPNGSDLWSHTHPELRITECETNVQTDQLKASGSMSKITGNDGALKLNAHAKRRSSLPTHPVSTKEHFKDIIKGLVTDHTGATLYTPSERLSKEDGRWNYLDNADKKDHKSFDSFESSDIGANALQLSPFFHIKETDILQDAEPWPSSEESCAHSVEKNADADTSANSICRSDIDPSSASSTDKNEKGSVEKDKDRTKTDRGGVKITPRVIRCLDRPPKCLDEKLLSIEIPNQEEEDVWGSQLAGLDQVEPWEDLSTTKEWVTSPLHSIKLENLFPMFTMPVTDPVPESKESSIEHIQESRKDEREHVNVTGPPDTITEPDSALSADVKAQVDESGLEKATELIPDANFEGIKEKANAETKQDIPQLAQLKPGVLQEEMNRLPKRNTGTQKQKGSASSQRFFRQASHETCIAQRNEEKSAPKHRPYSLNLDLGHRCIRDISNRQNLDLDYKRGEPKLDGLSPELEMFLRDRQAPVRRNSAPVSVSSVRTAFMIKTGQAKAVPVIPPKLQYSHVPSPVPEKTSKGQEKSGPEKMNVDKADSLSPLQVKKDPQEERENCKPLPRIQRQASMEKPSETGKPMPEFPVLRRKRSANGDSFMDCPRPERSTLHQRSSFRNRPRPQSLILFSPPFPIMDYHPVGEDGKQALSPIKSPVEKSPLNVLTKELSENLKTPDGVTLRNKMTLPKSGQRLETSTSCFYQPQRRSMIFDNRSNRQIE
ncbi:rho GTPase-activating protein 31 [Trichomycterus rosablanca]|uniref:rho GTPase-activating protein 31 n=1 Tax=Trichomycterus rosablanca TaxID=2290929 RepID=UPI002F357E7B